MKKKRIKRVLVHFNGKGEDGCSWYRALGPWSRFAKDYRGEVEVFFFNHKAMWQEIRQADCLFLLRPNTKEALEMAQIASEFGVPVWTDWDDQVLAMPSDNSARFVYQTAEVRKNVVATMGLSHIVTTSTAPLAFEFRSYTNNCHHIPNAYDEHMARYKRGTKRSPTPQVLYRGTITHQRDLAIVDDAIVRVDQANEELVWFFMGMEAWSFEKLRMATFIPPSNIFKYFEVLGALNVDVGIVPLHDSVFNRCKSNIAALEISYAGGVPLVPDWPEWDIPGVVKYKSVAEFEALLSLLVDQKKSAPDTLLALSDACHKFFREERSLTKMNTWRKKILDNIT